MANGLSVLVQQLLDKLVESGAEEGLQVAAYVDGELVVDAWAGGAGSVDGESLFTSWSTTKGFAATCIHLLAEGGLLDYDTRVAACWPEFASHGKDGITVAQVLSHTAGIPQMPAGATPELITDWEGMCAAIAAHEPLWAPGTRTAYHALVFGWIVGEIVRRVDGRSIAQFAQDELCAPLGIDGFYLGIPDDVEERVIALRDDEETEGTPQAAAAPSPLRERAAPAHLMQAEAMNRPDVRRASYPGAGGIMNARAIARLYAMLGNGGELGGNRLLSRQRVEEIASLQTDAHDEVLGARNRKGLGYMLGGDPEEGGDVRMGASGRAFGHPGHGGSIGFADPTRKLAFGMTKSLMKSEADKTRSAAFLIAEAVRELIDAVG